MNKKRCINVFLTILIILSSILIISCSRESHQDPAEIIEIKKLAYATMAEQRTPEQFYEILNIWDQYQTKDKELHDLKQNSETKMYMYYEHPSKKGVLLIHGLGASPNEMQPLAKELENKGYTIINLRLSGHGEDLDILEKTEWEQWYNEVKFAYDVLDYLTDETYVVGMSTGASLGLLLAKDKEYDGLVAVAPAAKFKDWKVNIIGFLKHFKKYSKRDLTDEEKITYSELLPTESVHELKKLVRAEKKVLKQITEPTIIMQATNDPRMKKESAEYIYDNIATKQESKGILWFESDEHVILNGKTQEFVISEIIKFIEG
jgi:carboxylesterase